MCAVGAAAAVALLRAPSASHARAGTPARGPLESMFQDDRLLIDSPTATVTRTLDELRGLGVDRLRLTVLWSAIAPDPLSARPPAGFDPSQPAAYPTKRLHGVARLAGIPARSDDQRRRLVY